jgi:hypothetical protein
METAIVTRSEMAMSVDVDSLQRMGKMLAMSGYFEKSPNMDQAIAQMCTKILAGRELGFGPFAAVNGIYIIQGRPSVSANLMASAVKASGRYDYKVHKMDATVCEIEFFEISNGKRTSLGMSSFNAIEAKAAQTKNMDKFPRNMLFARAMSNGVRWYCPDVFSGNAVYVPEELGADVDQEGNVIDSTVTVVTGKGVQSNGGGNGNGTATGLVVTGTEAPATKSVPAGTNANGRKGNGQPDWFNKFHAVGTELYGKDWDAKRKEIIFKYTMGAKESAKELDENEALFLTERMQERLDAKLAEAKKLLAEADVPEGTEDDNPFDGDSAT